jgi:hypothetical protein
MKTFLSSFYRFGLSLLGCVLLCHCGAPYGPQAGYYAGYPQASVPMGSYAASVPVQGYNDYTSSPYVTSYPAAAPQNYNYPYAVGNYAPQAYPSYPVHTRTNYSNHAPRCATPRSSRASAAPPAYYAPRQAQPRVSRYRIPRTNYTAPPTAPPTYYTAGW